MTFVVQCCSLRPKCRDGLGAGGIEKGVGVMDRELPRVYRRAATALVRCQSHLDKARREVLVALEILEDMDDPEAPWPTDASERGHRLQPLEGFVQILEE